MLSYVDTCAMSNAAPTAQMHLALCRCMHHANFVLVEAEDCSLRNSCCCSCMRVGLYKNCHKHQDTLICLHPGLLHDSSSILAMRTHMLVCLIMIRLAANVHAPLTFYTAAMHAVAVHIILQC